MDAFCTCTEFYDNCLQHTKKDNVCPRSLAAPGTREALQKPLSADPTAHSPPHFALRTLTQLARERTAPSGVPGPAPPPSRSGTTPPGSASPPPAQRGLRSPRLSLRPAPLAPARLCPGTPRRGRRCGSELAAPPKEQGEEESRGRLTQCWAAWRHGYSAARGGCQLGAGRTACHTALRATAARGAGRSRGRAGARGGLPLGGAASTTGAVRAFRRSYIRRNECSEVPAAELGDQ